MKQSPKRKFLTKKESPIKLSKKDPLWPGGGDGFDVNMKPSQSSLVSPVGQPISLTVKENNKLKIHTMLLNAFCCNDPYIIS